jgi:hypothetical protein
MDLREQCENVNDLIRINSEFGSKEIDESDLKPEKHHEPRI